METDKPFGKSPLEILGIKVNPEALACITAGDKAFQEDNYNNAVIHYTKAISLDSKNHYPYSKRGKCYQLMQQYDKALEDLFKSKSINDDFENNQSIAECFLFKKEFMKAINHFEIAINHLEKKEMIDKAKMLGIDYRATKARALNNLAICQLQLGQFEAAISSASKGIEANPNYSNNFGIRGMIHIELGNRSQGISDLQSAARLGDQRAAALLKQI